MIKLTSWPEEQEKGTPTVYVNPAHITVLEATEGGTIVGVLGQGLLRVREGIDVVVEMIEEAAGK